MRQIKKVGKFLFIFFIFTCVTFGSISMFTLMVLISGTTDPVFIRLMGSLFYPPYNYILIGISLIMTIKKYMEKP